MRRRRRERGFNQDKELWINPKKFFKIIFPHTFQYKTLRIPAAVAKEFKPRLPAQATVTIRTGLSWKIELEKIENELCFAQGMAEFMEQNGIELGYFLEFEYQGNNRFQVYIFDLSCTEIDYPTTHDQYANNVNEKDMPIHRDDDIVLDRNSNNPSFTITVKNFNVSDNCYLRFPKGFCDKHEEINLYRSVTLRTSDGKNWRFTSCHVYGGAIRLIGKSWKKFVRKNHWNEHKGAKYTFVLVDKTKNRVKFEVIKE